MSARRRKVRWRLVLGEGSGEALGGLEGEDRARDDALGFLYDREYDAGRNARGRGGERVGERKGGLEDSQLTIPEWINAVHTLFPRRTIERLEQDALERYQLEELVTRPELLSRAQPSMSLLKAVLRTRHLMNPAVLAQARHLVRQVVEQLLEKLAREVSSPFLGARSRQRTRHKLARNFDARATVAKNLAHFDPVTRRLVIHEPIFRSRTRRKVDRWRVIVLVDASGSMLDSTIHAAITAAIFAGLTALETRLVMFDTQVVDLSDRVQDPVETLLSVQLGGGTDIGHALDYASGLVDEPRRTILVLISDLFEGGPIEVLYTRCRRLIESGVTLLCLAALDERAEPSFDRAVGQRLANMGAHVAAMTPGELAEWVAEKVGSG